MADSDQNASKQKQMPRDGHPDQRPAKGKIIPGDETDDEADLEEFGERGLGVAAKE